MRGVIAGDSRKVAVKDRDAFTVVLKRKHRNKPTHKIVFVTVLAENGTQAEAAAKQHYPGYAIDSIERKFVIIHKSKR